MKNLLLTVLFWLFGGILPALSQGNMENVQIQTVKVKDGIYMLVGQGGNIGLSIGEDGVFMIDDQFAPLSEKIMAAIKELTDKPVKFLINTHWHFDHTGGNENFGKSGSIIVAHHNIYQRMSVDNFVAAFNMEVPAASKEALPVVTFNDEVTFHMNNLHIAAKHVPNAHTDGDSYITFGDQNVAHLGDLFFNGLYPFIDAGSGGSIYGMIDAIAGILPKLDEETKIIPGHGPLANKQDLQNYHDMLVGVVDALTPLAKKGLSAEDAAKQDPLKDLNDKWGKGFLQPPVFISIVYPTIVANQK